jgi:hypothetical protein
MAKVSAASVDYMELPGARKDAGCDHVNVPGGVSSHLGCCNDFDPSPGVRQFRCGTCTHLERPKQPLFGE